MGTRSELVVTDVSFEAARESVEAAEAAINTAIELSRLGMTDKAMSILIGMVFLLSYEILERSAVIQSDRGYDA